MNAPSKKLLAACSAALGLASCANPSHLIVFQHSNLGVNAGVSPATNNFHLRVGLRREFAAVVPKYKEEDTTDPVTGAVIPGKADATSAYVAARMRVISPWQTPEINEILATGNAAINAASGSKVPGFITNAGQ